MSTEDDRVQFLHNVIQRNELEQQSEYIVLLKEKIVSKNELLKDCLNELLDSPVMVDTDLIKRIEDELK